MLSSYLVSILLPVQYTSLSLSAIPPEYISHSILSEKTPYNAGGTSYPQLEREYGVNRSTLSNWVKQLSPIKVSEKETVTLKEYKALLKEIQRLKIENEILKKATAIFAKEQ